MQVDVIDAKKTAMIVVDMQNDFVASGAAMETPEARAMVPELAEALNICRHARSRSSIRLMCTAATGAIWDSLMTCIRRSPIVRR